MTLTKDDLHLLSHAAISAAYQAGHLIKRMSTEKIDVIEKSGGDSRASQVVTEVDHLAQELILRTLEPTCSMFDLALLTEESADDLQRLEKDYFWCIDPLDGTLPFIESTPGYSVSIALVSREGVPYIGIIYDPVTDTLYSAVKGQGATRNGKMFTLPYKKSTLTIVCDRSFLSHEHYSDYKTQLEDIAGRYKYKGIDLISTGGAAMNAMWVLEQTPAVYFKPTKDQKGGGSIWDYAASACIFSEFGSGVSDAHGTPLDLNRKDSTFMNHCGIIFASDSSLHNEIVMLLNE